MRVDSTATRRRGPHDPLVLSKMTLLQRFWKLPRFHAALCACGAEHSDHESASEEVSVFRAKCRVLLPRRHRVEQRKREIPRHRSKQRRILIRLGVIAKSLPIGSTAPAA